MKRERTTVTQIPIFSTRENIVFKKLIADYEEAYLRALKVLGVTDEEMKGTSRKRHLVDARAATAVYIMRHYPKLTLTQIARLFSRHHSSIINYRKVSEVAEVKLLIEKL